LQLFAANIYKVRVIRYAEVPREVLKKSGSAPHVPVIGRIILMMLDSVALHIAVKSA
jgi:hypothetical protein